MAMVERPRWADWLVLVLAFQAHWLFDHSDDALHVTRRPVWWVVIAVLVVGTVMAVAWFVHVGPDDRREFGHHAWIPEVATLTVVATIVATVTLGVRRLAWRIRYE